MKKVFFIIIGGYLLIGAIILMISEDNHSRVIDILSIKKPYARLLTEDETIDIPIYYTEDQSFLTEVDLINRAYISSDMDEVEIEVIDIKNQSESIQYDEKIYYKYYIEISMQALYNKGLKLNLMNAILNIDYDNDVKMGFDIGDMVVLFEDLNQPNQIDFNRMYGIYDDEAITGIYLSLMNKTGESIELTSIDCLSQDIRINLGTSEFVYETEDYISNIRAYVPEYEPVIEYFSDSSSLTMNHDVQLLLVIEHLNTRHHINRFPLIIHYRYHQQDYQYIIDDFIFYDTISDFYDNQYDIETYQYQYS
jgi:hypothetical protein